MTPDYWTKATRHLSRQCPTMGAIIKNYAGESLRSRGNAFQTLLRAIAGQQISVKAADSVWNKLVKAVDPLTPENLLRKRETTLRKCGFSGSKVTYARNLAQFFKERELVSDGHDNADYWSERSDEEIIKELTSIKGIGSWTAEMFLIFHLLRPDVFPIKDLGVLKGIERHYNHGKKLKDIKSYHKIAEKWAPYRTVGSWYMWRALDPVPVEY